MLRYRLLYLILLLSSIFALWDGFISWLNEDGKEYDLFNNEFKYIY